MRLIWICLVATALGGQAIAADRERNAETAVDKAEALERKAAAEEGVTPRAKPITRPEAQAVDPTGKAPLDDAITCLSRSIYWEAKGARLPTWRPSPASP